MNNKTVWVEKYRPTHFNEIVGNYAAIIQVRLHIKDKNKAIILYGNPGVGKTTMAHVIANELNWEILELNSSEQRTAKVIKKIVGSAVNIDAFDNNKKLILLDEVDNTHGNYDRGGIKEIISVIKNTKQPIILTCNEVYKLPYQLRNICTLVELKNINPSDMFIVLNQICEKEQLDIDNDALNLLVKNANGDLRLAINNLQANTINDKITISNLILSEKQNKENIFKTIQSITHSSNITNTYNTLLNSEKNPEELIQWVEQNLNVLFKDNVDLFNVYEHISKSDIFLGRVRSRQNYKLWKYAIFKSSCLTETYNNSNNVNKGFIKVQSPQHWSILKTNAKIRNQNKELFSKLSKNYHISSKHISITILPFLIFLMQNKSLKFSIENNLTKNEISYMLFQKLNNTTNSTINAINELYELSQQVIKLNNAEKINENLDSVFDINNINDNKKIKKSKDEIKKEKLSKQQFNLDDF